MSTTQKIIRRVALSVLAGLLVGFLISEISYQFLRETSRAPETIELVIPEGTAEQIARGETPPTIPEEMTFVVGDVLLVHNQDITDHQLGPVWIPASTSASLNLDEVNNFIFACSFQPSSYLGLDVREPVTLATRIGGVIFSGLPLGAIIALYSLIVWPIKSKAESEQND
jgi:uncharacterized membrane protein YraQ (UPF0718 family)